ncbi:MAG: translocation/assembly module TamB domain-containing protein, partial [Bacteroidia bacterium]
MWIVVSVVAFVLILALVIQIPSVQNYAADKATAWLSKKLNTRVEIGEIGIAFPKSIYIKNIYVEDLQKDTLLYGGYIKADIAMLGLLSGKAEINSLRVDDLTSHIRRTLPDSAFNFDFIVKAFAGDSTAKKTQKDTSGGMKFAIYDIELNNINFKYNDAVTAMDIVSKIGHFETDIDKFDLDEMRFNIDGILLENSYANITQNIVPEDTTTSESALPDIKLNKLNIANVQFNYTNRTDFQQIKTNIGELELLADELDLKNKRIGLEALTLKNSKAAFILNETIEIDSVLKEAKKVVTEDAEEKANPNKWVVTLDKLNMQDNGFAFDNFREKHQPKGVDFNHLNFSDIDADIKDVFYSVNKSTTFVKHLSLKDTSGFVLNKFTSHVTFDSIHTELNDLLIETPQTKIADYAAIRYSSLDNISDDLGDLLVQLNLENSHISFKDILMLQPKLALQPPFAGNANRIVHMDGQVEGAVKDLKIRNLNLSTANNTSIVLQGNVKGLPDAEKAYFDISFPSFRTSRGDIYDLIPRRMLPDQINIPGSISARGFFRGTPTKFTARADANTSYGDVSALAYMQMPKNGLATYQIDASARKFDVGKLVKGQDSLLGPVTVKAEIDGAGLNLKEMNTDVKIDMQSAQVLKYNYKDLTVRGKIQNQAFTGKAEMNDTSIAFVFDGTIGLSKDNPVYKFTFDLKGADFQDLKLTEDDLRAKGKISANIRGTNLNDITGDVAIGDVLFVKKDREYPIESFLFASINQEKNKSIDIKSDFLDGSFKGTINIGDLPTELKRHFNRYFTLHDVDLKKQLEAQNFTFDINLKKTEIITDIFYPDLRRFIPGTIKGSYNSALQDLKIAINIPQLIYLDYTLDTIKVDINSDPQKLNYNISLVELSTAQIKVENPSVSGNVQNDSITVAVQSKDKEDKVKFLMAGIMQSTGDKNYKLSILPDGVVFNYEQWAATPGNYIKFGKKILYAKDVKLFASAHSLNIDSRGETEDPNAPMNVNFRNFDLAAVTGFLQKDKNIVSGVINGDVELKNLQTKAMAFEVQAKVNDFSYLGDTLGDVIVKADNVTANRYTTRVQVIGNGNNVIADGYYVTNNPENAYFFDIDIEQLNLASVEAYTGGQLREMSGAINGDLRLSGSTDAPNIIGKVNFDNSAFTVDALGSRYRIDNESVVFNNSGVYFPDITIFDSLNNKADVSGYVYTKYFKEFRFDLGITSDNFRVMNSTEKDNQMYYGTVFVSSRIKVSGDMNNPVIDGRLRLNKGTAITVVLPDDNDELVSREGVVEFIDKDTGVNKIMYGNKGADTVKTQFTGVDLNTNIEIDKEAKLKIIVDPEAGDYLDVAGTGTMSLGLTRSGTVSLTGRYEISEGTYQLTFYNFVKRRFNITSGSTITWFGSPTDASMNITAIYETETAPLELVEPMLATDNELERNRYKQKLPFEVHMNMTGQLMKPVIKLDIDMPEDERGAFGGLVYNRIYQLKQDESELNKQVFALLVLGRFLAEDPLARSGGGNTVGNAIKSSLSELLSQQLNAFASRYIK